MLNYLERVGAWFAKRFGAPINTSAVLILATYTTLWGLWLANPFWTVFDQAPIYDWMADVMPEYVWGGIAIGIGLWMAYGVKRHTFGSLSWGAFAGWMHWSVIALGYFLGDWQNTGGVTSLTMAVYCAFIFLNLRVNRVSIQKSKHIV